MWEVVEPSQKGYKKNKTKKKLPGEGDDRNTSMALAFFFFL
jgi:hypothetical protein